MSELADAPVEAGSVDTRTAGAMLRSAREASGLHVAALAVALKVPVRKLEALEEDRFDDMGDAVFIRGLASSVCRTLKVDPQPILQRLPQTSAPRLVRDSEGLNAPFRAPGDGPQPSWPDRIRQPVPALVIAILFGALVISFAPLPHFDEQPEPAAKPAGQHVGVVTQAVPNPGPASAPTADAVAKAAAGPVLPAVVAPAAALPPASGATVLAASTSGIVVIRAKNESWVEVVDAKGIVAVRKLLAAGEVAGASGALPLAVTVGRADATEVEVRGRKFDLQPVSRDNVARFEVR